MNMIVDAAEADWPFIEDIAARADVFTDEEMDALAAVWEESLLLGPEDSGYAFMVDREGESILGFVCYGPRDLADGVYDLYYLVVEPTGRRRGVGRRLLRAAEAEAREAGARLVMVEVSSAPRWGGSDVFYLKAGYLREAGIKDFFAMGDDLAVLVKRF